MDARRQQVGIRADQLLAREAADPGRLDADPLDRARLVADGHEIADHERLVQHDRERREQVAQDVLGGERDRDAADAEPGDQRGDVEPEVVEDQQERDRPDHDAREQLDQVQRVGDRPVPARLPPGIPADPADHDVAGP